MDGRNPIRDKIQEALSGREPARKYWYGVLGRAGYNDGVVDVPSRAGYVYVTLNDGSLVEAYNTTVPSLYNYPVVVGYDPQQGFNNQLCVIGLRNIPRQGQNADNIYAVKAHHASHEWLNKSGGRDVVYVHKRQYVPLRPTIVPPFYIWIERDVQKIGSQFASVGGVTANLAPLQSALYYTSGSVGDGMMVLLSLNLSTGVVDVTSGSVKAVSLLGYGDIPAVPTNSLPICAVRLYTGQTRIVESRTMNDLIDLRSFGGTGGASGSSVGGSGSATYMAVWSGTNAIEATPQLKYITGKQTMEFGDGGDIDGLSGHMLIMNRADGFPSGIRLGMFKDGYDSLGSYTSFWRGGGAPGAGAGSPLNNETVIGSFLYYGLDGIDPLYDADIVEGGFIKAVTTENWDKTHHGMKLVFVGTTAGSAGASGSMVFDGADTTISGYYRGDGSQLTGVYQNVLYLGSALPKQPNIEFVGAVVTNDTSGSKTVVTITSGSGYTPGLVSGHGQHDWYFDGAISSGSTVGKSVILSGSGIVSSVTTVLNETGTAGSTTVNILVAGSSVFNSWNKPTIMSGSASQRYSTKVVDFQTVPANSMITANIDGAGVGAKGLTILVAYGCETPLGVSRQHSWYQDGVIVSGSRIGQTVMLSGSATLTEVTAILNSTGTSGSSTVDILVSGSSVFLSSNRPVITSGSASSRYSTKTPDTTAVPSGAMITMDIVGAGGGANGLTVLVGYNQAVP